MRIVDQIRERQKARKRELSSNPTLDQILGMRLSELSRRNIALRIYSEVLGCEIWLCSSEEMAAQIKEDDPGSVTYTVDELRKLYSLKPSPEDLRGIYNAKTVFPGSKIIASRLKEDIEP